jgi:hypothetical protein
LRALAQHRVRDARACRLPIDQERARAARTLFAAKMRARQAEPLAQKIGEVEARLDRLDDCNAIDREFDRSHQAIA